ncbi:MAG TPA: TIGR03086 family metal-binding protein [Mycobacteriales bacterium]|nr:TIGR03086 family metal-binding protein [Mycobacteriales bacterium]
MDDMTLLSDILDKTADLVAGVHESGWDKPTPCSDYTVKDLVGHMVGWSASFDAAANGRTPEGDPAAYQATDKSAAEFRLAVSSIVGGWRDNGTDRTVSLIGGSDMPGQMVFDMTMMEYLAHGWDLAKGSGQPVPYTEDEAAAVLERAKQGPMANDEYRGPDKPFGHIVDVPESAPAIERFAGFMGRTP